LAATIKIEDVLARFPRGDNGVLINVLQEVQGAYGWISESNVYAISRYLNVPASKIYGVATFYAQFRLRPIGRHIVNICRGTACHVKGSERLLPVFEQEMHCKVGETTKDGKLTLRTVNCMGCCSLAPAVNIDTDFYGNVKSNEIKKMLRKYE